MIEPESKVENYYKATSEAVLELLQPWKPNILYGCDQWIFLPNVRVKLGVMDHCKSLHHVSLELDPDPLTHLFRLITVTTLLIIPATLTF